MTAASRREALAHGQWAEGFVAQDLERRGFSILARNWRGGGGELDLVALREEHLCFVEVKSSTRSAADPERLSAAQQRRLISAAEAWLASAQVSPRELSLSVVLVSGEGDSASLEWYSDAFDG
ncbi:MAG: YraN family protein [Deltaproteobacteria bacterium]|nr:YraN family protein [Deltaproteobacteria bacterium]